jgi:threonine/homoserine/homoserine lactone efflux protein
VAIGHGIVEFPLIIVITLGMGTVFQLTAVKIAIGLAGGAFLWLMAISMLRSLNNTARQQASPAMKGPVTAGIILSGGNPYFLFWWATIGIKLATDAKAFGIWAFAVFAVLHWSCDLIWLWALSWAGYGGKALFGPKLQKIVMLVCGCALLGFGLMFIIDALAEIAGP